MDKTGRYYFLFSLGIKLIVSYFIITIALEISDLYLSSFDTIFQIAQIVAGYLRTFLILGAIGVLGYLLYEGYLYYNSLFRSVTKIPVFKAWYLGYFDLAYTYDRLATKHKNIEIDTKYRALRIQTEEKMYFIFVREFLGTVEGNEKYDPWHIVKGRKKEYGRTTHRKQIPIRNPIVEANDVKKEYMKKNSLPLDIYIVLAGLSKPPIVDERFVNVYELESLIQ